MARDALLRALKVPASAGPTVHPVVLLPFVWASERSFSGLLLWWGQSSWRIVGRWLPGADGAADPDHEEVAG
jgi:hypothetical protein